MELMLKDFTKNQVDNPKTFDVVEKEIFGISFDSF